MHDESLSKLKHAVVEKALAYFNEEWLTEVVVDASPIGVGAILMQRDPRDLRRCVVIAYGS